MSFREGFFGYSVSSYKDLLIRDLVRILAQHKCMGCGKVERKCLKRKLQIHRIVSGCDDGKYTLDNIRVLCRSCHSKEERRKETVQSLYAIIQEQGVAQETWAEFTSTFYRAYKKKPLLFISIKHERRIKQGKINVDATPCLSIWNERFAIIADRLHKSTVQLFN